MEVLLYSLIYLLGIIFLPNGMGFLIPSQDLKVSHGEQEQNQDMMMSSRLYIYR